MSELDYAVACVERYKKRDSYSISAHTLVNAGRLSEESKKMVVAAVKELLDKFLSRSAMAEAFRNAGLI